MEAPLYNIDGKKAGTITLPESLFGAKWNADLVHQVVVAEAANVRNNVADSKGRGEVRGGGKKPWQQKGTGRARAGSSRSPLWKGGGAAHGPKSEKVFAQKVNRKMKLRAFASALSKKFADGEVLFVGALGLTAPKSAQAKGMLLDLSKITGFAPLATKKVNAALIGLPNNDMHVKKSFRNFGNITVDEIRNWSARSLLGARYVLIVDPEESLKVLGSRMGEVSTAPKVVAPKKRAPAAKKSPAKKAAAKKAK
jgi:large subunit ribosomal protein L4